VLPLANCGSRVFWASIHSSAEVPFFVFFDAPPLPKCIAFISPYHLPFLFGSPFGLFHQPLIHCPCIVQLSDACPFYLKIITPLDGSIKHFSHFNGNLGQVWFLHCITSLLHGYVSLRSCSHTGTPIPAIENLLPTKLWSSYCLIFLRSFFVTKNHLTAVWKNFPPIVVTHPPIPVKCCGISPCFSCWAYSRVRRHPGLNSFAFVPALYMDRLFYIFYIPARVKTFVEGPPW